LAVFFLADILLLLCGMFWLKVFSGLSLPQAFLMGFLPFIPGDLVKAFSASLVYSRISSRCRKIFA
jgi:biotin transport system substrate-specific component